VDTPQSIIIQNNHFWVSNLRVVFWEEENALIVSDLHFGKTGHFRKAGIAIPQSVYKEDLQCLFDGIQFFKATQLIVVGDMFHSIQNKELDLFERWRNDIASVAIHLAKGNHDILSSEWYQKVGIEVHEEAYHINGICFQHDLEDTLSVDNNNLNHIYTFTGHIHPGISMRGLGRQTIHVPCFYFGKHHAILPSFSKFTGSVPIKPKKGDTVFGILNNQLIKVQ